MELFLISNVICMSKVETRMQNILVIVDEIKTFYLSIVSALYVVIALLTTLPYTYSLSGRAFKG